MKNKTKVILIAALTVLCLMLATVYLRIKSYDPYGGPRLDILLRLSNEGKLYELDPDFKIKIAIILEEMKEKGYRPRIATAWRSLEDQQKALASGSSELKYGNHNILDKKGNKAAKACDIVDDNNALVTNVNFYLALAHLASNQNLQTGITWGLADTDREIVSISVKKEKWLGTLPPHLGWDPAHVEEESNQTIRRVSKTESNDKTTNK